MSELGNLIFKDVCFFSVLNDGPRDSRVGDMNPPVALVHSTSS